MEVLEHADVCTDHSIKPEIISVKQLITTANMTIPVYQRPYKWSSKNVNQLLDDILLFKNKPAYRLGTIVYQQEKQILNIVDGQQRSITLLLIALAIENNTLLQEEIDKTKIEIPTLDILNKLTFHNTESKNNIRNNYFEIQRRIKDFDEETVSFFYERCEVVKVVLTDISEAFQFFDSQNTRGVDLDPHDLLKAFHLREMMDNSTEQHRIRTVDHWENMEPEKLTNTFALYLYRIRNWSNDKSARKFIKGDVDIFKGISPSVQEPYPFADIYRISHFYIEGYNNDFNRRIDKAIMKYPFQLDQVVINGSRFFEMISHYVSVIESLTLDIEKDCTAKNILKTLETYEGKGRIGDQYVRNLFDCALIYYIDKFGKVELERAVEKIFIWAYSVRLTHYSVQLASIDNRALEFPYIFKSIKNSLRPNDFLNIKLQVLKASDLYDSEKTKDLKKIFKQLSYIYE